MALLNCSLFSLFPLSSNSITTRRIPPLILVSSLSSHNVSHRINHSRTQTLNPKFSISHQPQEETLEFQHLPTTLPSSGGVQDTKFTKAAHEVITVSLEENQDTGSIYVKDDVHSVNEKASAANGDKVKQANTNSDKWWQKLQYVLVILMQRESDGGQKGLYKLKYTSFDSYIAAFEDYGDANNFCVLLESYFEDVEDFCAYPVPMTMQEVNEEITFHGKKVVVVKKRQLELYAGQPFGDVEMSLRSLIEQDQNVS